MDILGTAHLSIFLKTSLTSAHSGAAFAKPFLSFLTSYLSFPWFSRLEERFTYVSPALSKKILLLYHPTLPRWGISQVTLLSTCLIGNIYLLCHHN
jgi:hypothetical protein